MAVSAAGFSVLNAMVFAAVPGVTDRSTVIRIRWVGSERLLTPVEFGIVEQQLAPSLGGLIAQGVRRLPVVLPSGPGSFKSSAIVRKRCHDSVAHDGGALHSGPEPTWPHVRRDWRVRFVLEYYAALPQYDGGRQ
jgi:hypothetical protein